MNAQIQQGILGEYADQGYWIEEDVDTVVILWFKDQRIAVYSQTAAKAEAMRLMCQRHMERLRADECAVA